MRYESFLSIEAEYFEGRIQVESKIALILYHPDSYVFLIRPFPLMREYGGETIVLIPI